jgi:hypothetical protein
VDGVSVYVTESCDTRRCCEHGMQVVAGIGENIGLVISSGRNGSGESVATEEARLGTLSGTKYTRENGLSSRLHDVLRIKAPREVDDRGFRGVPAPG